MIFKFINTSPILHPSQGHDWLVDYDWTLSPSQNKQIDSHVFKNTFSFTSTSLAALNDDNSSRLKQIIKPNDTSMNYNFATCETGAKGKCFKTNNTQGPFEKSGSKKWATVVCVCIFFSSVGLFCHRWQIRSGSASSTNLVLHAHTHGHHLNPTLALSHRLRAPFLCVSLGMNIRSLALPLRPLVFTSWQQSWRKLAWEKK